MYMGAAEIFQAPYPGSPTMIYSYLPLLTKHSSTIIPGAVSRKTGLSLSTGLLLLFQKEVFDAVEIIQLGSIYFDGKPFFTDRQYNGGSLSIGNTIKGKSISWINVNGLLVSDHVICTNISWDNLNQQGFIFGKTISIDGNFYLCRSLKVGSNGRTANEWDEILDATSEDDSLWHWKDTFFWGQETTTYNIASRAYRGYFSARYWNCNSASYRHALLGFRPALEPLVPDSLISDSLIGTTINVLGNGGSILGVLTGFTDYDLFLSPITDSAQITNFPWCCQQDGTVIIDRSATAITKTI